MSELSIDVSASSSIRLLTKNKYCNKNIILNAICNDDKSEAEASWIARIESDIIFTKLPDNLTEIGQSAFRDCSQLLLTSLPEGITSIANNAFNNCSQLALTSLPEGITSIGGYAFRNCTSLTILEFKGTPTSIYNNVFYGCTNLLTINVPWAEGEVANAPWGATNATINYNYTGG